MTNEELENYVQELQDEETSNGYPVIYYGTLVEDAKLLNYLIDNNIIIIKDGFYYMRGKENKLNNKDCLIYKPEYNKFTVINIYMVE